MTRATLAIFLTLAFLRPQGDGRVIIPATRSPRGETCFDPPAGMVDWRVTATRTLGSRTIARPDTAELRRNMSTESVDESIIKYQARLPSNLESRGWLLVHDGGIAAMPGILLHGSVTYKIRADTEIVGEPRMAGRACLPVSLTAPRPAFVLSGVNGTGWRSEEVPLAKGIGDDYLLTVDGKRFTVRHSELAGPRARRMIVIRPPGLRPLLLVTWDSGARCDRDCCDAVYDLLQVEGDRLSPLAQNTSPCES